MHTHRHDSVHFVTMNGKACCIFVSLVSIDSCAALSHTQTHARAQHTETNTNATAKWNDSKTVLLLLLTTYLCCVVSFPLLSLPSVVRERAKTHIHTVSVHIIIIISERLNESQFNRPTINENKEQTHSSIDFFLQILIHSVLFGSTHQEIRVRAIDSFNCFGTHNTVLWCIINNNKILSFRVCHLCCC